jgi:hypothetical protein
MTGEDEEEWSAMGGRAAPPTETTSTRHWVEEAVGVWDVTNGDDGMGQVDKVGVAGGWIMLSWCHT